MLTSHVELDVDLETNLLYRLKRSTIALYEMPVEFWQKVLDKDMHFHLGHFPSWQTSFEDSMRLAVERLASAVPRKGRTRVLDVGCGWGGPAFELNRLWLSEVFGLTISTLQTNYVNFRARRTGTAICAETLDADEFDFRGIGKFDVFWLYESLDHMMNRRELFEGLHNAATSESYLAIATHCRSPHISQGLYSEFMGIQPIQTAEDITATLEHHGWRVLKVEDCTDLTFPVWSYWIRNLDTLPDNPGAKRLSIALARTEESYRRRMLHSVQLLAKRK